MEFLAEFSYEFAERWRNLLVGERLSANVCLPGCGNVTAAINGCQKQLKL